MRKILFRGKRNDNGKWVYSMTISKHYYNDNEIFSYYIGAGGTTINGQTLGQFTGLTDKNGTKIFEGDIVKGKDNLERNLEVSGYIDHKNGSFVIVGDLMTHYRWLDYELEVIGNIHDNPEVLKGALI